MKKSITALIILDGFGINPSREGNAILLQGTPRIDALRDKYPHTQLGASGLDVGLPNGQMGNSEVGHLNIGAGRTVYQELTRITLDIQEGTFFNKEPLIWAMQGAARDGKALHLMGLLSDGGVHSHNTHLYALLQLANQIGLQKVYIHCFMDGRDVPPTSGIHFIKELEETIKEIGTGEIASVMGRYWAMDRDNIWNRVGKAYDAIVFGEGQSHADSASQAVLQSYTCDETDEFVKPTVILKNGSPTALVREGDSVIFFNFRPDRARQLTRAFIQQDFDAFHRKNGYINVRFVSMTQYDETFTNLKVVNQPESMNNTLGEYLSKKGKTQLRIAETQKYAHVTFFFNGGVEKPNPHEDRVLVPSLKIATFDLEPAMSAFGVTEEAVSRITSGHYDVMILNFANCDMVGHTGILQAAMKAVETVDECVWKVVHAILNCGGRVFITSDHGNAEQMIDPDTGGAFTAHTTFPVPFIAVDNALIGKTLRQGGTLADIAPTMLKSMGLPIPEEMTGRPLVDIGIE